MDKLRLSDHSLTLLSSTSSKHQVTMMFQLKLNSTGERRTIYHLRLLDWESGGIPPSEESFLGQFTSSGNLLQLANNYCISSNNSH